MPGPWDNYAPAPAAAPAAEGPWSAYQTAEPPPTAPAPSRWNFPTTELRNQPPVAGGVARAPGIGTTAAANLATDPEQRRRIYAAQLFPGMPLREALSRIEVGPNGRLYVTQPNGSAMPIEPDRPNMQDPGSFRPDRFAHWAASGAGEALPMLGGIAGGLMASPSSLVGGPLAAAGGAAVGDAARQGLAGYFDPGEQPYNYGQTAREAGFAALGQFAGAAYNRGRTPNPLRLPERDVGRVARDPATMAGARAADANATGQGVQLSAGQSSALPSLLTLEDAALRNPATMDAARQFYERQGTQVAAAGRNMLDSVAPARDLTDAAQAFREAAGEVPNTVRRAANATARPAYQAAEQQGQTVTQGLVDLVDNPAVQQAMARARETARLRNGGTLTPADDFQLWDLTRRELRDLADGAAAVGDRTRASAYQDVLSRLSTELDAAFPTYPQARALAAPGQRLAATLEETATGRVGDQGVDSRARQILAPIFERSNPAYVAQARDAFMQAGQGAEWNAGIRAYLQDAIGRASTSQAGLNPAMLRRQIWANLEDGVRANMQAAMTPQQWAGFNRFMQVVESTARTFPENSMTVQRLGGQEALRAAGEDNANRVIRTAAAGLSPEVAYSVRNGLNRIADWRNANNVQAVVNNLFSDQGLAFLEQMARISPTSRRALVMSGQFLARPIASEATGPATPAR